MNVFTKLRALRALGLRNVVRVGWYRLRLRLGIHPVQRISATVSARPFFRMPVKARLSSLPVNRQWQDAPCYFGWFSVAGRGCPDWFLNPFNGKRFAEVARPWWTIPDFNREVGDIKTIWEASRFDWVIGFAQQAAQGDAEALDKLNRWLADWSEKNPPYNGPNWKCGQEASIRVMHLAMAALLLEQVDSPLPALQALIRAHLLRIAPTIGYAMAQNNNHGTSEAAALFIGGSWLARLGDKQGRRWALKGRKWLDERARMLIEADGSFSQYSANYHRVMLDTYGMAEIWRRKLSRPAFSALLYERLGKASQWLFALTNADTGDAPNLGANDGARLLPLTETDYRDYRPAVQLSMVLFCDDRAYEGDGSWNVPLQWLGIPLPHGFAKRPDSQHFIQGGYCALRSQDAFALLRYPRFRFRPSHADALHVDFWLGGANVLRDGGSFSYADDEANAYFKGTVSHNTIQFDDRDQMPRLGRFLFGEWLETEQIEPLKTVDGEVSAGAGYRDWKGARHHRMCRLTAGGLCVVDEISGVAQKAVLRWRLMPGDWEVKGRSVSNGRITVTVSSNSGVKISRFELMQGRESRYYLQETVLPVLEVEVNAPGTLETVVDFGVRRPGAALVAELKLGV